MLLIGSRALNFWDPTSRKGSDYDFICHDREVWRNFTESICFKVRSNKKTLKTDSKIFECEIIQNNDSGFLFTILNQNSPKIIVPHVGKVTVANPLTLYFIKKSHLTHQINWWKHIRDYHRLKRIVSDKATLNTLSVREFRLYKEAYNKRVKETNMRRKLRKPKLNVSNDQFFDNSQRAVGRQYDHDTIHQVTSYYGTPIFSRIKKDPSVAKCDKDLFYGLSYQDQIRCVREECFVIALERRIIPAIESDCLYDERQAFRYALERICTTLASGWFRSFAIDNVPEILKIDCDYVSKFKTWRNNGQGIRLGHRKVDSGLLGGRTH